MIKLPYNHERFYYELFDGQRGYIGDEVYRKTALISWLEENIEPMETRIVRESIRGIETKWMLCNNIGKVLNASLTDNMKHEVTHWVEIKVPLTEEQITFFTLKFS